MNTRQTFCMLLAVPLLGLASSRAAAAFPDDRVPDGNLARGMITPEAQRAIDDGLAYLAQQQAADGSFGTGQFQGNVAITSLCGLAFLAGDHIYKMDYGDMIRTHLERGADLTVGCIPVPLKECLHFGIIQVDKDDRILGFQEKPRETTPMPGDPNHCLGSMGIYVFTARLMYELLCQDATRADSDHDFGKNIIPTMIKTHKVYAFRFRDKNRKATPYWRDVGTLDAYYQANMDLIDVDPVLNLYDREWPIRTHQPQLPPPKFVFRDEGAGENSRRGEAHDSMVCQGCIISGGHVARSVLSPNVRVNSYAVIENSLLFDGVEVGRHCRIRKAIVDKDVKIPAHTTIGYNLEHDRQRGFAVTEQGIVVIAKAELPETFSQR